MRKWILFSILLYFSTTSDCTNANAKQQLHALRRRARTTQTIASQRYVRISPRTHSMNHMRYVVSHYRPYSLDVDSLSEMVAKQGALLPMRNALYKLSAKSAEIILNAFYPALSDNSINCLISVSHKVYHFIGYLLNSAVSKSLSSSDRVYRTFHNPSRIT